MKKRIISTLLSILFVTTVVSGCGNSDISLKEPPLAKSTKNSIAANPEDSDITPVAANAENSDTTTVSETQADYINMDH